MQRSLGVRAALLALTTAVISLTPAGAAMAHGDAHQGDLEMTIGFGTEPAYSGQPNSVQLIVVHGGEPVTDLKAGDMTVEVTYADETSEPMDLEPDFFVENGQLVFGEAGRLPGVVHAVAGRRVHVPLHGHGGRRGGRPDHDVRSEDVRRGAGPVCERVPFGERAVGR